MGISSLCIYYPLRIGKREQAEQYIKATTKRGRSRTKYQKYELIPMNLLRAHIFYGAEDYKELLPSELFGTEFSAADFGRITRIRGIDRYSALNTLVALGIVECEKRGRANVYKIV
jgi:hypothetical protein